MSEGTTRFFKRPGSYAVGNMNDIDKENIPLENLPVPLLMADIPGGLDVSGWEKWEEIGEFYANKNKGVSFRLHGAEPMEEDES